MTNRAIFILGTGTDIGKIYISGLLAKKIQESHISTGYYKPVLSGAYLEGEKLIPGDARFVVERAALNQDYHHAVSYIFKDAVSPHLAAMRNNCKISLEKIMDDFVRIKNHYDFTVVEGAGGVICPISLYGEEIFQIDIVKALNIPIILVADSGLGTINSTLLSIDYLKNNQIKIIGVIMNNFDNSAMQRDNAIAISKYGDVEIIDKIKPDSKDLNISCGKILNLLAQ